MTQRLDNIEKTLCIIEENINVIADGLRILRNALLRIRDRGKGGGLSAEEIMELTKVAVYYKEKVDS